MNINNVFGGDYLKSEHIKGRGDQRVVIEDVVAKDFENDKGGKDSKLVISFRDKEKKLVCNGTNANMIAEHYGPETDEWIGKTIILYVARVEFGKKLVDGIRVRQPEDKITTGPIPSREEMDDDIPF